MQHKMQAQAAFSSTKQQLASVHSRPLRSAAPAPAVIQHQQQQQRTFLQPLHALATSLRQPLVPVQQQQQQPWQQRFVQQQGQQQRKQQRVLVVFAVPSDAPAAAGEGDEGALDPNIPAVDQDFDLLGSEVRHTALPHTPTPPHPTTRTIPRSIPPPATPHPHPTTPTAGQTPNRRQQRQNRRSCWVVGAVGAGGVPRSARHFCFVCLPKVYYLGWGGA
jgi:hypothetical protein